jgi:GT2 family glycosyltransferase
LSGRVWVVVLNWNGKKYIRDCLRAALAQTYPDFVIACVDNASTDGSREIVQDEFPEVRLIALPENLHYARGTNAGIQEALRDPLCEFVCPLNNDTRADPEWLSALVQATHADHIGSAAAKLLLMDHPNVLNGAGIWITRDGAAVDRGWLQRDEGQFDRDPDVFGPSGGAALYRREALETVGLFDADFVAYLEDVDLAWRLRIGGYASRFAPDAIVYHKHSASSSPASPWKTYISERNRIWNLVQNYPWRDIALAPPWNAAKNIVALRRRLRPRRYPISFGESLPFREVLTAHLRGRRAAYAGLSRALHKRRLRRAYRTVDAADVEGWFRRYGIRIRDVPVH